MHVDVSFSVPEQLADRPWGGVLVHLRVRAFFCDNPFCKCTIVAENFGCCLYERMDKEREVTLWQESRASIRTVRKDQ